MHEIEELPWARTRCGCGCPVRRFLLDGRVRKALGIPFRHEILRSTCGRLFHAKTTLTRFVATLTAGSLPMLAVDAMLGLDLW